ncbi:MAG: HEPN domain-containing protein [Oscillospiraceae bacterium]|jgi:HEPN domain-containing protein|nr:HEPN domain-containing protein [Oscillospiraceae bacterium]
MDNYYALHWFEFADDDLDSAMILAKYGSHKASIICYHCQQAVEKYLKGYLISKGVGEPPHIHNLLTLKAMCEDYDSSFSEIMTQCNNLNPYGVRVKYPDEVIVDERAARQAIADARTVQAFEPVTTIRAALEADYKEHCTVTQVTAITGETPHAP